MKLLRITQSKYNQLKQLVITAIAAKSTVTAEEYSAHGIDSRPPKDTTVLYTTTQRDGDEAIIGCLNKDRVSEIGETRLFCVDSNGAFKYNVWLRSDGTMLQGDSKVPAEYTNFAVKYNELKIEYDKTKTYLTTLKTATQAALVSLDAVVPGVSATFTATMSTQVVGDISGSKNENIKYPA